jgi:hypothetical protein
VSGSINSELGNYTNTADLNAQLENYSITSGIIERPADYADNDLERYIQLKGTEADQGMQIEMRCPELFTLNWGIMLTLLI